jgi:hypothetical protein
MRLKDFGLFDVLMKTYPGWITGPELLWQWNAMLPWWAFWRRRSARAFQRVMDEFTRYGCIEVRWQQTVVGGVATEVRAYRVTMVDALKGRRPLFLHTMRQVAHEERLWDIRSTAERIARSDRAAPFLVQRMCRAAQQVFPLMTREELLAFMASLPEQTAVRLVQELLSQARIKRRAEGHEPPAW